MLDKLVLDAQYLMPMCHNNPRQQPLGSRLTATVTASGQSLHAGIDEVQTSCGWPADVAVKLLVLLAEHTIHVPAMAYMMACCSTLHLG